jgi:hypothetical protein
MLDRPTSAPVWSPVRWLTDRLGALTGPFSGLLRYVLIAAILAAIGCLYLWQVNDLSTLHEKTLELQGQASVLEQQNVGLAEQLAQWNSPAYVDKRSAELGYAAASKRIIAAPPGAGPVTAAVPVDPGAGR